MTPPPVRRPKRASLSMLAMLMVLTAAPLILVYTIESPVPPGHRLIAAILWISCLIPLWITLSQRSDRRRPIPFLPVVGIAYGWYYALGITYGAYNQHWRIIVQPDLDYFAPLGLALVGWVMLLLGYRLTGIRSTARRLYTDVTSITNDKIQRAAEGFVLVGLPLSESPRWLAVPVSLIGLFQFGNTLYLLGTSLLVTQQESGLISLRGRLILWLGFGAGMVLALGGGTIAPALIIWATLFFSVWLVRQSFGVKWTVIMVVAISSAMLFKSATGEFRWMQSGTTAATGAGSSARRLASLTQARVQKLGLIGALQAGHEATSKRSANLELFADVIRRTPSEVPYWGGETYLSLVGLAIPRVLWPDKPTKALGQAFGKRYQYIDQNDYGTSFNLPFLVEFYANFGALGVWFGMFVVGVIYRRLDNLINRPGQTITESCFGLVLLMPLLNIESDFSLIFGGLFLNGVLLWILLRLLNMWASRLPPMSPRLTRRTVDPVHTHLAR